MDGGDERLNFGFGEVADVGGEDSEDGRRGKDDVDFVLDLLLSSRKNRTINCHITFEHARS